MTIEEKRQKLAEFCDKQSSCLDCVLGGEKCRCGRGAHFQCEVGDSGYMTDEEIIAAYELAFPGTEGDSIFITGDKDGGMAVTNTGYEFWQDGEAKIKLECTDPTPVIKDSGSRREFDTDEPHDRAFCWNILCAIWTCKHKPELNDYSQHKCTKCGKPIPEGWTFCDTCWENENAGG